MERVTDEAACYTALATLTESDYRELAALIERHGSWAAAWDNFEHPEKPATDPGKLTARLNELGIKLLFPSDAAYPPLLREIPWPPHALYVLGEPPVPTAVGIAVVGTRKATEDGRDLARRFAADIARAGHVVVSGLAFGIDAAAHAGCLDAGGRTIAVLANGLDTVYPRTNERLARRILENGGAIVSEYPPGAPPLPYRFLERNRLVSGLANGIVIIEAPERSGSLATARFALEQNRDVFVVPGPAGHPNFKGSHDLIRAGAELVAEPAQVLAALGLADRAPAAEPRLETDEAQAVVAVLEGADGPLDIDKIIELTNLEARIASRTVSFLLVSGRVREDGDGYSIIND
jgi:DNA processing protein